MFYMSVEMLSCFWKQVPAHTNPKCRGPSLSVLQHPSLSVSVLKAIGAVEWNGDGPLTDPLTMSLISFSRRGLSIYQISLR